MNAHAGGPTWYLRNIGLIVPMISSDIRDSLLVGECAVSYRRSGPGALIEKLEFTVERMESCGLSRRILTKSTALKRQRHCFA